MGSSIKVKRKKRETVSVCLNGTVPSNLVSCKVEHKITIRYINLLGYSKEGALPFGIQGPSVRAVC